MYVVIYRDSDGEIADMQEFANASDAEARAKAWEAFAYECSAGDFVQIVEEAGE